MVSSGIGADMRATAVKTLVAVAATVCGAMALAACANAGHESALPAGRLTEVQTREAVAMLPPATAGDGGWCLRPVTGVGCPTFGARLRPGPIILENWTSISASGEPSAVTGLVVTTSVVAAVSVEGGPPVDTHAQAGLVTGLRAVVIEFRGHSRSLQGTGPPSIPAGRVVALSASGQTLPANTGSGAPLEFEFPSREFTGAHEGPGICSLKVSGMNVHPEGGRVLTAVDPHRDVLGREFINCVNVNYRVGHASGLVSASLDASVLVDASHVGSTPGPLLDVRRLVGEPGVYEAPGIAGPLFARRVPGGWLTVGTPERAVLGDDVSMAQRVRLLEHLHARIPRP
jgi:hypothetical protein